MALERMDITAFEAMTLGEMETRLEEIETSGRPLILTKDGRPHLVMVTYEWWRATTPGPPPTREEVEQARGD